MRKFGELIGIAFQMKDDLFDYYNEDIIGKPTGIDIKEQKMTLPLIYALKIVIENKKVHYSNCKKYNTNNDRVSKVLEIVKKSGGINYTLKK